MKKYFIFYYSIIFSLFAEESSIFITYPIDGVNILSSAKIYINYHANPGPKGDHLHLTVDGLAPIILLDLKGSYTFEKLKVGSHEICLKLVDQFHTPLGTQKCITVNVQ